MLLLDCRRDCWFPDTKGVMFQSITHVACLPGPAILHIHHLCPYRYVVALKVPKFSGYKPGIFYDTAEPQHTAMLVPGKQSGRDGYFDMLLVAGEAHDQVSALLLCWFRDDSAVKIALACHACRKLDESQYQGLRLYHTCWQPTWELRKLNLEAVLHLYGSLYSMQPLAQCGCSQLCTHATVSWSE